MGSARVEGSETPAGGITPSQQAAARVAGWLYLALMVTAIFGESFVRGRLIAGGDAARTAANILGSEGLFRLSIAGDLVTYAGVIVLTWALYVVLRPVHPNLALLAAFFRVAENAVLCMATVCSLVALRLLSGVEYLESFDASQLHSLARLALSAQGLGMRVAFVLLGLGSSVFAYLLLKSRYVPRAIAAWGLFSSLLLALGSFVLILFPAVGASVGIAYMAPMGLYEVGLGLWLAVRGIRMPAAA